MTRLRLVLAAALAWAPGLAAPGVAAADEPQGCAAFRWPIDAARSALAAARKPVVFRGAALSYGAAATLELAPYADGVLPHPPERAPKAPASFAGRFTLPAPARPGLYTVTIAAEGWIDVIDNGSFLRPRAFSGALGCEGARKSVKFDLPARPLDVQLSGVKASSIALIVAPDE